MAVEYKNPIWLLNMASRLSYDSIFKHSYLSNKYGYNV